MSLIQLHELILRQIFLRRQESRLALKPRGLSVPVDFPEASELHWQHFVFPIPLSVIPMLTPAAFRVS